MTQPYCHKSLTLITLPHQLLVKVMIDVMKSFRGDRLIIFLKFSLWKFGQNFGQKRPKIINFSDIERLKNMYPSRKNIGVARSVLAYNFVKEAKIDFVILDENLNEFLP